MSKDRKGAAPAAPTVSEIESQIKTLTTQANRSELENAIEVGRLLIQAKPQIPHGQWEDWVRDKLSMPRVTAARNMRLAANVQTSVHFKSIKEAELSLRKPRKPKPQPVTTKKPREAGKRLRALHTQKRENDTMLLQARIDVMKMVGILEGIDLPAYGVGDADHETLSDIHAELTILATWLDQSLDAVSAEMDDMHRVERIRKLREDNHGRTEAEMATARRLADKLERKRLQAVTA